MTAVQCCTQTNLMVAVKQGAFYLFIFFLQFTKQSVLINGVPKVFLLYFHNVTYIFIVTHLLLLLYLFIPTQVALLKRVLAAWQSEVEKQPSSMSVEEAYQDLGLEQETRHDDTKIRKAYFKMAQKYHPDKNPEGRVGLYFMTIYHWHYLKICSHCSNIILFIYPCLI